MEDTSNFIVFPSLEGKIFLPYPLISNDMENIHMYGILPDMQTVIISEANKSYLEKRGCCIDKK